MCVRHRLGSAHQERHHQGDVDVDDDDYNDYDDNYDDNDDDEDNDDEDDFFYDGDENEDEDEDRLVAPLRFPFWRPMTRSFGCVYSRSTELSRISLLELCTVSYEIKLLTTKSMLLMMMMMMLVMVMVMRDV